MEHSKRIQPPSSLSHPVQSSFSFIKWHLPTSQHHCKSCDGGQHLSSPVIRSTTTSMGHGTRITWILSTCCVSKHNVTVVAGISVSNSSLLAPWLGRSQDLSYITRFKIGLYNIFYMYPGFIKEGSISTRLPLNKIPVLDPTKGAIGFCLLYFHITPVSSIAPKFDCPSATTLAR